MGEDFELRASDDRLAAALAAVRGWSVSAVSDLSPVPDEAARAVYGGVVRRGLMATYGVPAPSRLDRVIAEAAVLQMPADRCVAFIGEAYDLRPLPQRRY